MYGTLAEVYDFLVPEPLLSPEGSAAALAEVLDGLPPGARVLDCACGTGTLAVGMALRGFDVTASDASPAMVERTRALAAERGVPLVVATRAWADLGGESFDAVLCVGNSLTHAAGQGRAADGARRHAPRVARGRAPRDHLAQLGAAAGGRRRDRRRAAAGARRCAASGTTATRRGCRSS